MHNCLHAITLYEQRKRFSCLLSTLIMSLLPQKLWADGGVGRFYKGFTPCIIRAMPANASMLFTVDRVTNYLNESFGS